MNIDYKYKDLVGLKVISVSNALVEKKVQVGTLVEWQEIKGKEFPIVDFGGKKMLCFSILFPYSDELYNFLNTFDEEKVWEFCADISLVSQIHNRKTNGK